MHRPYHVEHMSTVAVTAAGEPSPRMHNTTAAEGPIM
jgi:hypothetical protein